MPSSLPVYRTSTLLVASICAAASSASGQLVVRESASVWSGAKPVALVAQQRWCSATEAEGCDFRSIDDVSLLPDGGIVAISQMGLMRRFAADGKLLGDVARKGQGPGEYQSLVSAQFRNGQMTWFDIRQMRIASVGLDGKPGAITRLMPPHTMQNMYLAGESLVVFDVPAAEGSVGDTVAGRYRTVPSTGEPRVLGVVRTPSLFKPGSDRRPPGGPFEPRIFADVGVNADVAHSNGAEYVVHVFPTMGPAWRLESQAPKRAVSPADRDSVEAVTLKAFRAANLASLPPLVRAQFEIKRSTFPPLTNLRVLRDGTLWIRPVPAPGATLVRWDVFSRDGKRIGRAQLPPSAQVRDGTKDWILVVELNDDDIPSVTRYKVN